MLRVFLTWSIFLKNILDKAFFLQEVKYVDTTKYKFHKLTPIRNAKIDVYADALDYAFRDDDLKNIAITGAYCSGKSSILATYKEVNPNKSFIHISLAHFETATNLSNDPEDNKREYQANIKNIEGKILNQLIHQIDAKKIPQTHFKVKGQFSKGPIKVIAVSITVFLGFLIFLLNRNTWVDFVNGIMPSWLRKLLSPTTSDWFVIAVLMICGIMMCFGFYNLLKLQRNKNFLRKLSVQGNEIEIFGDDDDSFFDKHLNEVLYLFQKTESDAIVFEDMDRYNSNEIFEKLREINYLLNNNPNYKNQKVFRFLYLLRDDIFTSKDRTKFFDFIIPIVPIIDAGNSYDKFIEYFRDGGILDSFDSDFLQEISTYIDDMRLLKNIYNEYRVYHDRIQSTELDCNKLLAMIMYKNLFPRDFTELQLGKGYVFCLFRNKKQFIEEELIGIEESINKVKLLLQNAEKEHLKTIDELDLLYISDDIFKYEVNGKSSRSFPNKSDFIKEMRLFQDDVYYESYNYNPRKKDVGPIFNEMQKNPDYLKRKKNIENKALEKNEVLNSQLHKLNTRKKKWGDLTLSEVVQSSKEMDYKIFQSTYTNEIGETYKYDDVKGSLYFPLIKYLIRNKHIDENYPDYMSYFYEQSISRVDQIFVRSVFDVEAKAFNYSLKDAALVSKKISPRYYSQPEVLNFDLFAFLLKSESETDSDDVNLSTIINQIKNNNRIDFILEFWATDKEKPQLFKIINNAWPSVWQEILQIESIQEEDKNRYLVDTFYYSPIEDIQRMNNDNTITRHISKCESFLSISKTKISPIIEALDVLKVSFETIDYDISDKELFNQVYCRNLYEINQSMIFLILNKIYKIPQNKDFFHKSYTILLSRPDEPIVSYISNNMNAYIILVCSICKGEITDDQTSVLDILNNPNLDQEYKEDYIDLLITEIEEIENIDETSLWPKLLINHNVPCTNVNILSYYFGYSNDFDDTLTDFINTSTINQGLSYNCILQQYGEDEDKDFFESLICNNDLDDDKYTTLLSEFGASYSKFNYENLDDNKVNILIDLEIIEMNHYNLDFVRKTYASCVMHFILSNIDEYAQETINQDEDNFMLSELIDLLGKDIVDENILRLLSYTTEPISIDGISVSDAVKNHIIENNYNRDDLPSLVSSYEKESPTIKNAIFKLAIREIAYIADYEIKTPYNLLIALLQASTTTYKRELFANQLEELSLTQAIECFKALDMIDILTVFEGKWPTIEIDEVNTRILKVMVSKKWISSFEEDKGHYGYYRVRARRNIKG